MNWLPVGRSIASSGGFIYIFGYTIFITLHDCVCNKFYGLSALVDCWSSVFIRSKIEVPRDVRNSKSGNMTSSVENGLNIRANASPKVERTRCPEE